MNLHEIEELARTAGYNETVKARFKKEGMAFLRKIKKLLTERGIDNADLRWNQAGIAVSGDLRLHGDKIYIALGDSSHYWRFCQGKKDYTGGVNRKFAASSPEGIVDEIANIIHLWPR